MKNKYFPQTFLQSLALLFIAILLSIPVLYLRSLKIISDNLFLVINFEVWMLSVLFFFYLINRKRNVSLSNHFKFDINKTILVFISLITVFQISIFLPLSFYSSDLINGNATFSSEIKYYLFLTISAAIFEELIFRGIILEGYLIRYKAKKAILISALFFGIIHFNLSSPTQFIGAIILGFITGYIYYHSRSVGMVILVHFTYNITVYLMSYIHTTYGNYKITSISDFYGSYSVFLILITFLILIYLIYYILKNKNSIISNLEKLKILKFKTYK